MKKKIISILVILLIIGAFIATSLITYASKTKSPLWVNLTPTDANGIGYGIGDPQNAGKYIWNITTYDDTETGPGPVSKTQRDLYCVNAEYGKSWFGDETTTGDVSKILGYELYYDIQSPERQTLLDNVQNDTNNKLKNLLDPTGTQYRQLLWLFDNAYIAGKDETVDQYLEKFGILKDEELNQYYNKATDDLYGADPLTEADIIALQKMAIWYFTNNASYNFTDPEQNAWLTISEGNVPYTLNNAYNQLITLDRDRNNMAMDLYRSLINSAVTGAEQYTSENGYKLDTVPVSINGISENTQDAVAVEMERNGANYLIGPIVIQKNNDLLDEIKITVKDQKGDSLTKSTDYTYTDNAGKELENITSDKDLVGVSEGFYISVPRSKVESVNIKVTAKYKTTLKHLWLDGDEGNDGKITLNSEQPLVEIIRDPQTLEVELTSKPEEFDLALRKYIIALHDKNGTPKTIPNARELDQISDVPQLQTGTTADYLHRKDPVVVEDGDIVTYRIIIYNEGDKAGYASKIIDQLPDGLTRVTGTNTVTSGKGNTYTLSSDPLTISKNQIVLDIDTENSTVTGLQPYTKTTGLDYDTIDIQCKVTPNPNIEQQIVLTNVAWIAEMYEYNEEQQKYVLTEADRDSSTATGKSPNVDKTNMSDWRGSTTAEDLSREDFFFEGEEDDDDFEKLVYTPPVKIFDLGLKKFIIAVSKDGPTIEENEYLKKADGTYIREPEITGIYSREQVGKNVDGVTVTDTVMFKDNDKNAVIVETGDYVLYTIRVYNHGELDGYASKIKDTLPENLEYVIGSEINKDYVWNIEDVEDKNKKEVITTEYYKKGGMAEVAGEHALLKALKPEAGISEQNPDYVDVQVLCRVTEPPTSTKVLTNYAQISEETDSNGNVINGDENSLIDIDSTPDNLDLSREYEDDEDYERIQLQYFDLSLRKFITAVNGTELKDSEGKYLREPKVNVTNLINGLGTTAEYVHSKKPLAVQVGDKVVYTIRVYNEGSVKGFASEVKDYLPPYLKYLENSEINAQYGWQLSDVERVVTTTYLADKELDAFNGTTLDYEDIKIECMVAENTPLKQNQTNIAEISEYKYNGNAVSKDIDSTADNMVSAKYLPADENLPSYKNEEINKTYVPGNEDDDDFEKVYIKEFDLALRKFITQVQDKEITTREPSFKDENGEIKYEHSKDALTVHVGDTVIYTLRIYNEGEISGYASEITDDIPEYLEYLPENSTNVEYMWKMYDKNGNETENVEEAVKVKTTYLSKENGEDNLINAFDGITLDYKDIKIAFKVKDPNSNTQIITNHAQISDDRDENNKPIKDKDSEPDEWNEGEDDQDIENVKVEYFDLSLLKFVSKVIVTEDGKETITETGYNGHEDPEPVVKVELHKKKLNKVNVKFGYGITITNEGDIPGYATEITDYVPEGLKFEAANNPNWTDEGNNVISTKQLENKLLQPGESATVEVILTWINGAENLALKTNTAEISEDKNYYDLPDRDSTPDNKQDGEDDIDIAKVILAISTGRTETYFTLTLGLLTVIAIGIFLIKKFVI